MEALRTSMPTIGTECVLSRTLALHICLCRGQKVNNKEKAVGSKSRLPQGRACLIASPHGTTVVNSATARV